MKRKMTAIALCAVLVMMNAQPVLATETENTPAPTEVQSVATEAPTEEPTETPTETPTEEPKQQETEQPTENPTENPTETPTENPTETPTENPTETPTENPTEHPTETPTETPTEALKAYVGATVRYGVVGQQALEAQAAVAGGTAPYAVRVRVIAGGSVVFEENKTLESAGMADVSYMPQAFGKHEIAMTVTDAKGNTAEASTTLPVAVIEKESKAEWEKSLYGVKLGDNWRENILAVAQSQLGYRESDRNFIVDNSGKNKGYTRYGDWYGREYQDWCAMFCAFVVEYAKIPGWVVASSDTSEQWRSDLEYYGAYGERGEYAPQPGDLIFFDRADENGKRDGKAEHIGIVESASDDKIVTIEGNVSREVRRMEYEPDDKEILGYGNLSVMLEREGLEQPEATVETFEAAGRTNTDKVNVRDRASTAGSVLFVVEAAGTELAIQSKTTRPDGETWYEVNLNNESGYIRADLVTMEEKEAAPIAVEAEIAENGVTLVCAQAAEGASYRWERMAADGAWQPAGEGAMLSLPAEADALLAWYRCVSADAASEAIRPARDELVDWLAQSGLTSEAIARALNASTLEAITLENNQLVYVRTGEVIATLNPATNYITDVETGLIVAMMDASGSILPVLPDSAQ